MGDVEAAYDDKVRVQRLRNADGGRPAGTEVLRQPQVLEGVLPVVATNSQEAGGGQPLVERVGERIADPVEIGLARSIVERQYQDQTAAGTANVCRRVGGLGLGCVLGLRARSDRKSARLNSSH